MSRKNIVFNWTFLDEDYLEVQHKKAKKLLEIMKKREQSLKLEKTEVKISNNHEFLVKKFKSH